MRMRKLGKGQSVMICGPMEVERKILRCSGKSRCDTIEVADVLQWSISETCIPHEEMHSVVGDTRDAVSASPYSMGEVVNR